MGDLNCLFCLDSCLKIISIYYWCNSQGFLVGISKLLLYWFFLILYTLIDFPLYNKSEKKWYFPNYSDDLWRYIIFWYATTFESYSIHFLLKIILVSLYKLNKLIFLLQDVLEYSGIHLINHDFQLVVIMCHPRSGSTNLTECLVQNKKISYTIHADTLMAPVLLRILLYPLRKIIGSIWSLLIKTKNKKITADCVAEEDHILALRHHPHCYIAALNRHQIAGRFPCKVGQYDIQFMLKYIQNTATWNKKKIHIAKPLGYAMFFDQIIKEFPANTKYIIPLRDPRKSIPSTAALGYMIQSNFGRLNDETFLQWTSKHLHDTISMNIYIHLANFAQDSEHDKLFLGFEQWTSDSQGELNKVCDFLGIEYCKWIENTEYKSPEDRAEVSKLKAKLFTQAVSPAIIRNYELCQSKTRNQTQAHCSKEKNPPHKVDDQSSAPAVTPSHSFEMFQVPHQRKNHQRTISPQLSSSESFELISNRLLSKYN